MASAAHSAPRPVSSNTLGFPKETTSISAMEDEADLVMSEFELALRKLRAVHEESISRLQARVTSFDTRGDDVASEARSTIPAAERKVSLELEDVEFVADADDDEEEEELTRPSIRYSQVDLHTKLAQLDQEFATVTTTNIFRIDRKKLSVTYMVKHPLFNLMTAFMIILNAAQIGYDAELTATVGAASRLGMHIWSLVCTLYFMVECVLRIYAFRKEFFVGDAWPWNLFDLLIAICGGADFVPFFYSDGESSVVLDALRALKLLRIIRVFRVFRVIKQLSNLMVMIADSVQSLLWALVMLVIIMYVFAICIMTFTTDWVAESPGSAAEDDIVNRIREYFGSLALSFFTLVVVMLAGVDFGEILTDLATVGWIPFALLMFFVLFTNLAVLNVVTGVFVDRALEAEKSQREYQVERALKNQISFKKQIIHLVAQIDSNADGRISRDELHAMLEDKALSAHWETLGLVGLNKQNQADRLFDLVDADGDGAIYVDEFLDKAGFLRGPASAIELLALQSDCHQIRKQLQENRNLLRLVMDKFNIPRADTKRLMMTSGSSLEPADLRSATILSCRGPGGR